MHRVRLHGLAGEANEAWGQGLLRACGAFGMTDPQLSQLFPQDESAVDEQLEWWETQGWLPYQCYEALYGKSPLVMTWTRLRERMVRDFARLL